MTSEIPTATEEDIRERAAIDRSVRLPVLFFFTCAAAWLFFATVMGILSSLKLRVPELWDDCPFLTYGRLFPVHMNALVYGWAIPAGIGVMLWLMARLTRVGLKSPVPLLVMGHVWNAVVVVMVGAIWFGFGRSIPLFDFPGWLAPIVFLTYLLMVSWIFPMFSARRSGEVFVSALFVLGAAVWFPWIFATTAVVVSRGGAPVMGAGVSGWYITNLIYFWFAPLALAVAYYVVPKIAGRPIRSYPTAIIGFWGLALLAGWTGFNRFLGGPFPAWLPAVSGAATILIVIPLLLSACNLRNTLEGREKMWEFSPTLRFSMTGLLMLVIYGFLSAFSSFFSVSRTLEFSHFLVGLDTLAIYGFFSMALFGAIYYIVPRITFCEWPSGKMIRRHFWFSIYGVGALVVTMLVGGLAQGGAIEDWKLSFNSGLAISIPYLVGRIIGWTSIAIGNLAFLWQLAVMFAGKGRESAGPTLIHKEPGEAASAEEAAGFAPEAGSA